MMQDILSTIGVLAAMVFVVYAAYAVTRFMAARARPGYRKNPRSLKMIDRFVVSRDKMIVLMSAGERGYLIGITNQSMTLLDTLTLPDIPDDGGQKEAAPVFSDFLNRVRGKTNGSGFPPSRE